MEESEKAAADGTDDQVAANCVPKAEAPDKMNKEQPDSPMENVPEQCTGKNRDESDHDDFDPAAYEQMLAE